MLRAKQLTTCQDLKKSFIVMKALIRFCHKTTTRKIVWLQKRKLNKHPTSMKLKKRNSSDRFPSI